MKKKVDFEMQHIYRLKYNANSKKNVANAERLCKPQRTLKKELNIVTIAFCKERKRYL